MNTLMKFPGRFLGAALLCLLFGAGTARASELHNGIWALSAQLCRGCGSAQGKRVAVVDFVTLDGKECRLGALMAEKMINYLSVPKKFTLVERSQIQKVLQENDFTHSRLFDPAMANRLGKLLGAQIIVCGTLTDLGTGIDANARMICCERGEVICTAGRVLARDATVAGLIAPVAEPPEKKIGDSEFRELIEQLVLLQGGVIACESPDSFTVNVWAERQRYQVGDNIAFYCRSSRDCYLTLIDIGPDGNLTVLLPNRFMPSNQIRAGRLYRIPAADWDFEFIVQPPGGLERIKAIASMKPLQIEHFQYEQYAFRSFSPGQNVSTRDIGVYMNKISEQDSGTLAFDSMSLLVTD